MNISYSKIILIFILKLVLITNLLAEQYHELTAFSISTARDILSSGIGDKSAVETLGWITEPKAFIVDDEGDLILLGYRNPSKYDLTFDDLVVCLRSAKLLDGKGCPGVSIDPVGNEIYKKKQTVKYFGGIENTRLGLVCFQADLLLKKLGLGLEPLGAEGIPNEWDLELDRIKSGWRQDPWLRTKGMSWFFPTNVLITISYGAAILHNCKISVLAAEERKRDITERRKKDKESLGSIFARSITENYDKIAKQHPVLDELKQLMKLSALAKVTQEEDLKYSDDLQKWIESYPVTKVVTPDEIPTLSRGKTGLGVDFRVAGGINLETQFYKIRAGDANAIKKCLLESRPNKKALTWTLPIDLKKIKKWPPKEDDMQNYEVLSLANFSVDRGEWDRTLNIINRNAARMDSEIAVIKAQALAHNGAWPEALKIIENAKQETPESEKIKNLYELISERKVPDFITYKPIPSKDYLSKSIAYETPGWNPGTRGQNLFEIEGRLTIKNFNESIFSDLYTLNYNLYAVGHTLNLRGVWKNRFELSVSVPFEVMAADLRALSGTDSGIAGGINNIQLHGMCMIWGGMWNGRRIFFNADFITPLKVKLFEHYYNGKEGWLPFAHRENWKSFYSINVYLPYFEKLHLFTSATYSPFNQFWGSQGEFYLGGGFKFPIRKSWLWAVGLRYDTLYNFYEGAQFEKVYDMYSIILEVASKDGVSQSLIGLRFRGGRTEFLVYLDAIGKLLWSIRKWY